MFGTYVRPIVKVARLWGGGRGQRALHMLKSKSMTCTLHSKLDEFVLTKQLEEFSFVVK